jgi:hypothetical protein
MFSPPFSSVTHINQSEWAYAPKALSTAKPGDLLHVGELHEKRGGLLKLRRTGSFISVSADQAWKGAPIPWPREADGVGMIIIEPDIDRVMFIPKDRPACSSSGDDASS